MLALILALLCLFSVDLSAGRPDVQRASAPELEVYLKNAPSSPNAGRESRAVLNQMARELTVLMGPAGFRVVVRGISLTNSRPLATGSTAAANSQYLVVVELRGSCAVPKSRPGELLRTSLPLASSSVVDGTILPFTWIDCDALNLFLAPALAKQSYTSYTYSYGRAMARLLAHEFYHVLTHSEDHASAGIAKARLSTNDLLADHFQFDQRALGRFHPVAVAQTSPHPPEAAPEVHDEVAVGGR